MLTACYLVNISPLVPLGFDILKKVWTGKEISYNHMKVFGFNILEFASVTRFREMSSTMWSVSSFEK